MIGVTGIISTGKSSFINSLYGDIVADVKLARCTIEPTEYKLDKFVFLDMPGMDDEERFKFTNFHLLKNMDMLIYITEAEKAFTRRSERILFSNILEQVKKNNYYGFGPYYV